MALTILIDILVVVLVLYRQIQVRRVRAQVNLRLAAIFGVVGLVELVSYAGDHHLSGKVVGVLVLSMLVGAGLLGAIRAATVHLWQDGDGVFRQGTWLTMALWVVSFGLHFASEWWIDAWKGPSGLASASLLLYIGLTYGVQNAVVHRRAQGMLAAAGPAGGRSAPFAGHWWGTTWTPPSRGPAGPPGAGHPGAIDASSEPLPPPPPPPPAWPPPSAPPPPPPASQPPDDDR
ncbi:MAG TPA: hypothetical protein VHW47_08825 [Acidimicrobiales bacterium]|nr:hypothetical protein [Acidimicrobiales bacterium]